MNGYRVLLAFALVAASVPFAVACFSAADCSAYTAFDINPLLEDYGWNSECIVGSGPPYCKFIDVGNPASWPFPDVICDEAAGLHISVITASPATVGCQWLAGDGVCTAPGAQHPIFIYDEYYASCGNDCNDCAPTLQCTQMTDTSATANRCRTWCNSNNWGTSIGCGLPGPNGVVAADSHCTAGMCCEVGKVFSGGVCTYCGNGVCEDGGGGRPNYGENAGSCPADCSAPVVCNAARVNQPCAGSADPFYHCPESLVANDGDENTGTCCPANQVFDGTTCRQPRCGDPLYWDYSSGTRGRGCSTLSSPAQPGLYCVNTNAQNREQTLAILDDGFCCPTGTWWNPTSPLADKCEPSNECDNPAFCSVARSFSFLPPPLTPEYNTLSSVYNAYCAGPSANQRAAGPGACCNVGMKNGIPNYYDWEDAAGNPSVCFGIY